MIALKERALSPNPTDQEVGPPRLHKPMSRRWLAASEQRLGFALPPAVVRFDPNPVDADWSRAWAPEGHTFASWLAAWIEGTELFDPGPAPVGPAG